MSRVADGLSTEERRALAWDVQQLLASGERPALVASVGAALPLLPEDARRVWARIVGPR